jgi:hypothetical protein
MHEDIKTFNIDLPENEEQKYTSDLINFLQNHLSDFMNKNKVDSFIAISGLRAALIAFTAIQMKKICEYIKDDYQKEFIIDSINLFKLNLKDFFDKETND